MNTYKLLLVEDDAALGMLLMDFLESSSYIVTWKRDGLSALEQLKKQSYDLCILDISMPGMDGYEVCRQIKMNDKWIDIKLRLLTSGQPLAWVRRISHHRFPLWAVTHGGYEVARKSTLMATAGRYASC